MLSVLAVTAMLASLSPTSTVAGVVRDADTRLPLVGAAVSVGGARGDVITDSVGRFQVTQVPAGVRRMTVRCLGHSALTLDIVVPGEGPLHIDVLLASSPTRLANVDVYPARVLREPFSRAGSDAGARTFDASDATRHPLLSEPDLFRALSGGSVSVRPETAGALYVGGGRSDQLSYSIDGMPVFNPVHLGGLITGFNLDALADAELSTASPLLAGASVLSGSLAATTRSPGSRAGLRGAASSSHVRLTIDGRLDVDSAGYLFSLRQAMPRLGSVRDPNFLRGESGDWLANVSAALFGGTLSVAAYGSGDELSSRRATTDATSDIGLRNNLGWQSASVGASWRQLRPTGETRLNVWRAGTSAAGDWGADSARMLLDARRDDIGLQFLHFSRTGSASTTFAARVDVTQTAYAVSSSRAPASATLLVRGTTPVATISAERRYDVWRNVQLTGGAALSSTARGGLLLPRARVALWSAMPVALAIDASRSVQFVQSLRNEESVVSHMFPVELYVGTSDHRVPVAISDQVTLSSVVRPVDGVRFTVQAHARRARGVLLHAEGESGPFAVADVANASLTSGTADARGVSSEIAVTSRRAMALISYGWQRVVFRQRGREYVPEHSARHQLEGGITLMPISGLQIRVGVLGAFGRRATGVRGPVEWDGCSLADRACEFAGTPESSPDSLGATQLPYYLRTDLSVRKSWRLALPGRDGTIAAFGTLSNVFNRTNFLNLAAVGDFRSGLEMRSRSPLVVGIDWHF